MGGSMNQQGDLNHTHNLLPSLIPIAGPTSSQTLVYRTSLTDATLFPDGYAFPGNFYTDAAGNPQMLGPTVESYEGDEVVFEITNESMMGAATHCK
jgi:hypothetical protein